MSEFPPARLAASARGLLDLARQVMALKALPRTGWIDRGIPPERAESVADHSLGVAILAWLCALERSAAGEHLDPIRVLQLAILHDLAEAEVGDVPPYDPALAPAGNDEAARRAFLNRRHVRDPARAAAKRAAESAAMAKMLATMPAAARTEIADLWQELQDGRSREAQFVKQVDRLETFLQSRHYLHEQPGIPVESFRQEVLETIDDPLLAAIRDAALATKPGDGPT